MTTERATSHTYGVGTRRRTKTSVQLAVTISDAEDDESRFPTTGVPSVGRGSSASEVSGNCKAGDAALPDTPSPILKSQALRTGLTRPTSRNRAVLGTPAEDNPFESPKDEHTSLLKARESTTIALPHLSSDIETFENNARLPRQLYRRGSSGSRYVADSSSVASDSSLESGQSQIRKPVEHESSYESVSEVADLLERATSRMEPDESTLALTFEKYHPESIPPCEIVSNVFDIMMEKAIASKSTNAKDIGYIYIFELRDRPGYVKIGQTTRSPGKRKKEIMRCKLGEFELTAVQHFTTIPWHTKLEKIIKTDLWAERRFFRCPCGKKADPESPNGKGFTRHGEWFEMDKDEAMQRVENWREWMRSEPYNDDGVLLAKWLSRITNADLQKIVNDESTKDWWQDFYRPFPNPSWLRKETIEARTDSHGFEQPSRIANVCRRWKDVVCFFVIELLLFVLFLDTLAKIFTGPGFRLFAYFALSGTSMCWL